MVSQAMLKEDGEAYTIFYEIMEVVATRQRDRCGIPCPFDLDGIDSSSIQGACTSIASNVLVLSPQLD